MPINPATNPAPLAHEVTNLPGGVQPAVGAFSMVDDDQLKDGDEVPLPDTSTLTDAMKEAYVNVLFDLVNAYNVVPFVLNVAGSQLAQIVAANWSSRAQNSQTFWVAYVLAAFQGAKATDHDPNREATDEGLTGNPGGGSLIFIESIRDAVNGVNVSREESDTVVHEVGHAVANSDTHPVTGGDSNPVGTFSKYTPEYLAKIRSITRPWS